MALINNYDGDGNIVALKRYDATANPTDDFSNTYYSGTNELQSVNSGHNTHYTYDNNGNVISDAINRNGSFVYDYRNLLTDIRSIKTEPNPNPLVIGTIDVTYWTKYFYDEAGNRTHKQMWSVMEPDSATAEKYTGGEGDPTFNDDSYSAGDTTITTDGFGTWHLVSDEFYIRDASGKELALYTGHNIEQWNMYGSDNVGKIDADNHRYFYLKDHLGTVRATLDTAYTVVSACDYNAWGYPLDSRSYDASVTTQKYKFTGKERDNENNYDYFGARYYDSRVANWTSVDPLFEKHIEWTPYNYVLRSPIRLIDPDGKQNESITLQHANDVALEIHEWIGEHPEAFLITPEIPFIGPEVTTVLGIMSLPIPPVPPVGKASIFGIGEDGNLISPFPTETIDVTTRMSKDIPEEKTERVEKVTKKESPIWQSFGNYKNGIKTKGEGKKKEYYKWDNTHGDIEVYDSNGEHKGSMDPKSGDMYKPKVNGREIKDEIN